MKLASLLSRTSIARLAGDRSYARGVAYARDGRVERLDHSERRCRAVVRGTMPYWVELKVRSGALDWACDCPVGADGAFCKHCVAVALEVGGDEVEPKPVASPSDGLDTYLADLGEKGLVELIVEQADRDPTFRDRLAARAAATSGAPIDTKEWRRRIDRAFGRSRYVDYRAAPGWAHGVHQALDELQDLLDAGHAPETVELAEHAHKRAESAVQRVDGSDGWFSGISAQIGELHLVACSLAGPDPKKLARRLLDLELSSELDTFHRAALTYADVLGPTGIDDYRRLVAPRFDALGNEGEHWSSERFRITNARIGVALAARDPDELIAVKERDLRYPGDHEEIALALLAVGRSDEAIAWCERGIADFPDRTGQLVPVRELLAALLRDRGDAAAAVDVFWAGFDTTPVIDAYRLLCREADAAGEGALWRARATDRLRAGLPVTASTLVEVLLYEGDTDGAWVAANEHGCHQSRWMQLARTREATHPGDAIPIYEREVSTLIATKKNSGYGDAVKLMARIEPLQDPNDFAAYVERVRTEHKLKRNLMTRIAEQGW